MEDAREERSADVDALPDRSRSQERGGNRGRDRADDPGLVAAVPGLDLSAPGGATARGARSEAGRRTVRAESEGPGRVRMDPGRRSPSATGDGGDVERNGRIRVVLGGLED